MKTDDTYSQQNGLSLNETFLIFQKNEKKKRLLEKSYYDIDLFTYECEAFEEGVDKIMRCIIPMPGTYNPWEYYNELQNIYTSFDIDAIDFYNAVNSLKRRYTAVNPHTLKLTVFDVQKQKYVPLTCDCFVEDADIFASYHFIETFISTYRRLVVIYSFLANRQNFFSNSLNDFIIYNLSTNESIIDKDGKICKEYDIQEIFSYINDTVRKPNIDIPPMEYTKLFLSNLVQKNNTVKKSLTALFSSLLVKKRKFSKPFVIFAGASVQESLMKFFFLLGAVEQKSLEKFTQRKSINDILTDELNNINGYIFRNCKIPERYEEVKHLQRYMNGEKRIMPESRYIESFDFMPNITFIYITDDHYNYLKMKNIYGAIPIIIPCSQNIDFKGLSVDWHYLNSEFTIPDNKLFKEAISGLSDTRVTKDIITQNFVEAICNLNSDAECIKNDLYEAYTEYYKKKYGDNPLTKYMFSKQISMVYPIDTFRPHKSRDSYPYYFKGIDIDKEKYKAFKSGK